jgi:hypothetical protein
MAKSTCKRYFFRLFPNEISNEYAPNALFRLNLKRYPDPGLFPPPRLKSYSPGFRNTPGLTFLLGFLDQTN